MDTGKISEAVGRLDLRQLRSFAAVVDAGSINAAATVLAVAQPALSRTVRAMEETLGVRLLERSARGVTASAYGKSILHFYRLIESAQAQTGAELDAIRGAPRASISVGVGPVEGSAIASVAIDRILRRYPSAHVTIREGLYSALEPALLDGELDLVVGAASASSDATSVRPGLQLEYIGEMKPSLVVRGGHPLARKRRITLADVQRQNWIVPHGGTIGQARFERFFQAAGLAPPSGRVAAGVSSWTALALVLRSDLVALLPQQLIRHDLQTGALAMLPLQNPTFSAPVHIVRREGAFVSPLARELAAEIRAACRELSGEVH